jgi:hypothetical protein
LLPLIRLQDSLSFAWDFFVLKESINT